MRTTLEPQQKKSIEKDQIVYKFFPTKNKQLDDYTFRFVISDESVDRYGDVIEQEGMDTDKYLNSNGDDNPVVLQFHNHNLPAVGNVIKLMKQKKRTLADIKFTDKTEAGQMFANLYGDKVMRAVSVGIRVKDYYIDKDEIWHLTKTELVEVSVVNVPANANALMKAIDNGVITKELALEHLQVVEKSLQNILTLDVDDNTMGDMEAKELAKHFETLTESVNKMVENQEKLLEAFEQNATKQDDQPESNDGDDNKDNSEVAPEDEEKVFNAFLEAELEKE